MHGNVPHPYPLTPVLKIEGPISREDDHFSTVFEFHVTYESGRVMRWLLEFSHHKRTFTTRPAGSSDLPSVFPKMMLAFGFRPLSLHPGGFCDHLRGMLTPEDIAICAKASLEI